MRKQILFCVALLLLSILSSVSVVAQDVIPQPNNISYSKGYFTLNKGLKAVTNLTGQDFKVLNQFTSDDMDMPLISMKKPSKAYNVRLICTGTALQATQAQDSARLQGYELEVSLKSITIQSLTPTGLFYGLLTLAQLEKGRQIPCVKVKDTPRFPYRGLMIDCSRHFLDKEVYHEAVGRNGLFQAQSLPLASHGWRWMAYGSETVSSFNE